MRIFSDMNKLSGGDSIKLGCLQYINQREALKKSILIVCTGNSCRSQMAEGFANNLGLRAESAGTKPETKVNPNAVMAMAEIGIDITSQKPKNISEINVNSFDIVLTVCSDARDTCPVFPGFQGQLIHHPFDDPANAVENKLNVFRRVRDEIGVFLTDNFSL